MKENTFYTLIDKGKYNFFIFCCPAIFPFCFAKHQRIVTTDKWDTHRWEIGYFKDKKTPSLWYLHKDFFRPRQWINRFFRNTKRLHEGEMLYHITWNEWSSAEKVVRFMEECVEKNYPRKNRYLVFPWPNSNTFIQRVINNNPEIKITLPANAFGKNYT
jgi:hypothetical protein